MALNKAKIITVTSVKGGTGKTTMTLNIAGVLSQMQKKTIIVDFDLYFGSIAASLNLKPTSDIYTLNEDMMNNRFHDLKDYVNSYNEYIDVLAAPIDPRNVSKFSTKFFEVLLSRLSMQYEVILIDTNHITDKINLMALDHSDTVLYIMTNDLMDMKNMKTMMSIYKDMDKNNYKIILNEAHFGNANYSVYDIKNVIEADINYIIPKSFYINNIDKYLFDGTIMTLNKSIENSKGGKVITKIVNDIIEE